MTRLRRVAAEAAAQSRQPWLPEVAAVTSVAEMAEWPGVPPVLAHPGEAARRCPTRWWRWGPKAAGTTMSWPVGAAGLGLGPTVLRAETAAVAAGAVLCGLRQRFGRHSCVTTLREQNYTERQGLPSRRTGVLIGSLVVGHVPA